MRLLVIGTGRGADQIIDALPGSRIQTKNLQGVISGIVGFMDDNQDREPFWGAVHASEAARHYPKDFDVAVISVSTSIKFRSEQFHAFTVLGVPFANVIHPTAYVSPTAEIGKGNVILAQCHIGAYAEIGNNNFVSAKCSIEHHNKVGSHNTFGPGVVTSSRVEIGDRCRFGTGIFMEPGVVIGDDCIVASGAVLPGGLAVLDNNIVKTTASWILRKL